MQFLIYLPQITESESVELYNSISYAFANLIFTGFSCYVFGSANNFVLADVLNQCHRYSANLSLTIEKDPA